MTTQIVSVLTRIGVGQVESVFTTPAADTPMVARDLRSRRRRTGGGRGSFL